METYIYFAFYLTIAIVNITNTLADTPGNCSYNDILGRWRFYIAQGGFNNDLKCSNIGEVKTVYNLVLKYPNIVNDEYGNQGFWTMIYNQGFEVVIHGRKFFAFSKYDPVKSYCDWTMVGWSHDLLSRDWACYFGTKLPGSYSSASINKKIQKFNLEEKILHKYYNQDKNLIDQINSQQSLWRASSYKRFENITWLEYINLRGGIKTVNLRAPRKARMNTDTSFGKLPLSFDWRNAPGGNYVSPVRDQGSCGSCYAFASTAMMEARFRIISNHSINVTLSPQHVVDCNQYSQGCDGGFPYLVAGKFSEDFGMVQEGCYPYKATTDKCSLNATCQKYYGTGYEYVGGFYGGCGESAMKRALVEGGPIAVGFEVYDDFMHYSGGIYKHTGLRSKFNPFELTNHAVLIVGYGTDAATGTDFWTVKNSWGPQWGEGGYFRILRGADECGIESLAMQSTPIF